MALIRTHNGVEVLFENKKYAFIDHVHICGDKMIWIEDNVLYIKTDLETLSYPVEENAKLFFSDQFVSILESTECRYIDLMYTHKIEKMKSDMSEVTEIYNPQIEIYAKNNCLYIQEEERFSLENKKIIHIGVGFCVSIYYLENNKLYCYSAEDKTVDTDLFTVTHEIDGCIIIYIGSEMFVLCPNGLLVASRIIILNIKEIEYNDETVIVTNKIGRYGISGNSLLNKWVQLDDDVSLNQAFFTTKSARKL